MYFRLPVADPDFELRRGPGFNLLAQPAFLLSVVSSVFAQNGDPPLDPPLVSRKHLQSSRSKEHEPHHTTGFLCPLLFLNCSVLKESAVKQSPWFFVLLRAVDYKLVTGPSLNKVLVLSCLVLSCLVLSCLVLSCLVLSCLVLSCLVLSCLVLSCLVLSCLVLSCLVLSCLVLSCLVLSCLVLSCLVLSCLVLSCLVLSCLVLSCLVLSCLVLSFDGCTELVYTVILRYRHNHL